MQIEELTVGIVQTCCYILSKEDGQECIVIDPGAEAGRIRRAAGNKTIAAILLTHGHFDHIGAVRELASHEPHNSEFRIHNSELKGPRIIIHELDAPMLGDPELNASAGLIGRPVTGLKVKVLHTPGHTPGSVCYEIEGELFTGDTVFEYGWGRTDLPGGSEEQMMASLRRMMPMVRTMPMHAGH